ncbi:MAG: YgjV family protein [Candidatus Caccovivens sp.]
MSNVSFVLTQVLGLTATLTLCLSYVVKSKKLFLVLGLCGEIVYGLTFIFVGSWGAGIISLLSCLQFVAFYLYEKKNKKAPIWIGLLFVVLFVIAGSVTFETIWDIIPIATYSWFTVTLYLRSTKSIRLFNILPDLSLVLYDVMVKAYANAFEDGLESVFLITIVVADLGKSKISFKRATLPKKFLNGIIGVKFFDLQSAIYEDSISEIHNDIQTKLTSGVYVLCPIDRYG